MGLLQIQVDLLERQQRDTVARDAISDIDQLLADIKAERAGIDTSRELDPLIPLTHLIVRHFDLAELDGLAFESGIQPDEIAGQTLSVRAREVVEYADRHGLLADLVRTCGVKRPFVAWPDY